MDLISSVIYRKHVIPYLPGTFCTKSQVVDEIIRSPSISPTRYAAGGYSYLITSQDLPRARETVSTPQRIPVWAHNYDSPAPCKDECVVTTPFRLFRNTTTFTLILPTKSRDINLREIAAEIERNYPKKTSCGNQSQESAVRRWKDMSEWTSRKALHSESVVRQWRV